LATLRRAREVWWKGFKLQEILGNPRFERGLSREVPAAAGHTQASQVILCLYSVSSRYLLGGRPPLAPCPRGRGSAITPSVSLVHPPATGIRPQAHLHMAQRSVMQAVKIRTIPAGGGCRSRRRAANGEPFWVATSNQQAAGGLQAAEPSSSQTTGHSMVQCLGAAQLEGSLMPIRDSLLPVVGSVEAGCEWHGRRYCSVRRVARFAAGCGLWCGLSSVDL